MGFTVDEFNLAKDRMLSDFNKALTEAETLRNADSDTSAGGPATPELSCERADDAAEDCVNDVPRTTVGGLIDNLVAKDQ